MRMKNLGTTSDRPALTPPSGGGSGNRLPPLFRALSHPNFRIFWCGQIVSLIGSWMQSAAQWWLVYRLTHEPFWLGIVGTAAFLPVFLLSFVGGVVADRAPKRSLIVATQVSAMVLALGLSALTFSGEVRVQHVVAFAFLLGMVNAFDMPARQSFVIDLVGSEDLMNAVALNSSIFNAARVVGPSVAGFVIASMGEATCFLVNGLSFIPVITGLLLMRLPRREPRPRRPVLHEMGEGFRFVAGSPRLRSLLIAVAVASVFGMSFTILLPVFADNILGKGPGGYGLLMGSFGLGAVLGALRLAGRKETRGSARLVGTGMALFGVALIGLSFSRSFVLSQAMLFAAGGAMITQNATTNTLLQTKSPDEIRGRVLSFYTFTLVGLAPIGTFLAGTVAQRLSAPWAVRIGGMVCLLGAAWFSMRIPALRRRG